MYTDDIFEYTGIRIIIIPDDKLPIKSYKQKRTHRKSASIKNGLSDMGQIQLETRTLAGMQKVLEYLWGEKRTIV